MILSERIIERGVQARTEKKISGKTLRRNKIRYKRLLREKGLKLYQGGLNNAPGASILIYESPLRTDESPLNRPHLTVVRVVREVTETPVPAPASKQPAGGWGDNLKELEKEKKARAKANAEKHVKKMSRAKDIFFAGLLGVSTVAGVSKVVAPEAVAIQQSFEQYGQDSADSNITGPQLLAKYEKELSHITIGATFSPEQYWIDLQNVHTKYGQQQMREALKYLKYAHEELGINDMRLGIKWCNVVDENGDIDFSVYKPIFDYMVKHGMNIELAAGIKAPWWPEESEPKNTNNLPPDGSVISDGTEFAQKSFAFLDKFFAYLEENYTKEQLARVKAFQPENEPFQSFGDHGWTMSKEYMTRFILKAIDVFPNADIYVNSAGFLNIDQILDLFGDLTSQHPEKVKGKLVLAIDDHPDANLTTDIPVIGTVNIYNPPLINQRVDQIMYAQVLGNQFEKARERIKAMGVRMVMGEAGINQWNTSQQINEKQFNLLILREMKRILVPGADSTIYLWGIEDFMKRDGPEADKIAYIIKSINTKNFVKRAISEVINKSSLNFVREINPFRQGRGIS